jgi:hypothetical protein
VYDWHVMDCLCREKDKKKSLAANTRHGEPLWLSSKVVKNEIINEIERTRVRSPPRATSLKYIYINTSSVWISKTFNSRSQSYDLDLQRQRCNFYNATGRLEHFFKQKHFLSTSKMLWPITTLALYLVVNLKVVGLGPEGGS